LRFEQSKTSHEISLIALSREAPPCFGLVVLSIAAITKTVFGDCFGFGAFTELGAQAWSQKFKLIFAGLKPN
jgi:hypothetical protein